MHGKEDINAIAIWANPIQQAPQVQTCNQGNEQVTYLSPVFPWRMSIFATIVPLSARG
jgi:hypothetical protein